MSQLTKQLDLIDRSLTKVSEAFEDQRQSDFPYPIDKKDMQGEFEFWPEGGVSTAYFVETAADELLEGEIDMLRHILDVGLETVGRPAEEAQAVSLMQDKTMEMMKEYFSDPGTDEPSTDMFFKRSSDEEFKSALRYALRSIQKWIEQL